MNTSADAGNLSWLNLSRLPITVKALFTGYLMAAGLGL
ncbi:MAG: elongation factor-1 alpha, partial [Halothiobacillus sp.]|nr:elongation factor-1 alpha [Halothiobacillus sp.]